uniref:Uncharacterized protein n=1 Tax=Glossina palpalis gambiensis TaxID=67801 RepID=A0A1B0AP29_9MUSC
MTHNEAGDLFQKNTSTQLENLNKWWKSSTRRILKLIFFIRVTLPLLSGIGGGGRRAGKGGGGPAGMLVGWNESGKMLITPALGKCRGEFFGDIGRGGRAGARGCFGRCGISGVKFKSLTVPMHDSPVASPIVSL